MKTLLLIFLFSLGSQAQSFYCVLKTKADGRQLAPTLVPARPIADGVLTQYLVQSQGLATILGLEVHRLDSKRPYNLDFKAQLGAKTHFYRVQFTRNLGLVVHVTDEVTGSRSKYEFIEDKSSPAMMTINHKNGWTSEIGCLPN